LDKNAQNSLDIFCEYQKRINFPESSPYNHDVAILVSQIDFCSDDDLNCDTLGLAKLGGICDPDSSCNINQNTGLSLGFTIAHELGHKYLFLKIKSFLFFSIL
jgi:hypothetical protein